MGLFSWLRGGRDARRSESAPAAGPAQPARHEARLAYDPGLIATLKGNHRELLRICTAVQAAAAESRFSDIQHLLTHFKQVFQSHVAMENARFYAYVHPRVAHDREAADRVSAARRDMNEIGFEVLKVVDAYIAYPPTHLTDTQFKFEFEQAAAQLASRVDKVESQLYPLYRP